MDRRAPPGGPPTTTTRRRPSATLQRAASGGSYGFAHQIPKRPTLATTSGLSNVRSVSQPVDLEDLSERVDAARENVAAYRENLGMMVRSPDALSSAEEEEEGDDILQPPAKRMKMDSAAVEEEGGDDDEEMYDQDPSLADQVMPGQPLPGLTMLNRGMKAESTRKQRHCYAIDPTTRKGHGLDAPALATKVPPPKKVLDYTPWTGTHPEDVLTETVIKNGYSDNPKANQQNECNSAKAMIWPQLSAKNHTALQMLAYLYNQVLEKRQALGRCTAPSTFKPPPRVTVTDTKREAWLRDLAKPDVPLRKQSRTIPHGIRGKLLMEQCLGKAIPLQRAVWLAKCVGANELRAFRRKGVSGPAAASGEAKWVREWTLQVEQFLDSVIALCGQGEWREKMQYAVKLSTAFFSEKLLDMEHYLDWIVSSLAAASLDQLPIWIVLAQLYWKSLVAYGKRGKALAKGLLEHLHRIQEARSDVHAPLKLRLRKLIVVLAVSNRGCLVSPRLWSKYKALLTVPSTADGNLVTAMSEVARRNARIAEPSDVPDAKESSPLLRMYRVLDLVGLDVNIPSLATTCRTLVPDSTALITAFLEWASTLYRTGSARIYLAARLIAHVKAGGIDTDAIILQYLGGAGSVTPRSKQSLYMVVIHLVRVDSFSIGRYLQWLITSGAGSSGDGESVASGLLAALPTAGLPAHLLNTRATLLRRLGLVVNGAAQVEQVVKSISTAMDAGTNDDDRTTFFSEMLSLSSKLAIVDAVHERLGVMAKAGSLSLSAFHIAREVTERVGDLSRLADIIQTSCVSESTSLLATICDTITYHASSFAALGRLPQLVDSISEQYMIVRSQQSLDRSLIIALSGLMQRSSKKASFIKLLTDDLAICDQQSSLAVCSPASDSIIGMQATTLDSEHDIDAVFASGNTMDEQLMQRVFTRMMQYTAKPHGSSTESVSKVCSWLSQLHLVDGSGAFERIANEWLQGVLKTSSRSDLPIPAIESLIVTRSVRVHAVADVAREIPSPAVAAAVLRVLLSNTAADNTELTASEKYKLALHKEQAIADHPNAIGELLRYAAESPSLDTADPALLQFCIRCSSARPGMLRTLFDGDDLPEPVKVNVGLLMKALLQIDAPAIASSPPQKLDVDILVRMAAPLSATFCVEALRWLRANATWTPADDDAFQRAFLASFEADSETWPQLLEVAGEKVNADVREWAWENVLRMAEGEEGHEDGAYLHRCMDLLLATSSAATANQADGGSAHVDLLGAKLRDLEKTFSSPEARSCDTLTLLSRLRIYLRLSTTHIHSYPCSDEPLSSKSSRTNLLTALCALLLVPRLQIYADLSEGVGDIASTLADHLLDEANPAGRVYGSLLKAGGDDVEGRLSFILGAYHASSGGATTGTTTVGRMNLALAQPVASTGAGTAVGVSAQQRILARQVSSGQHHLAGPGQGAQQMTRAPPTSTSSSHLPTSSGQHHHQRFPSHGGGGTSGSHFPPPPSAGGGGGLSGSTIKLTPFHLRHWEILSDPTPVMGENDGSLSLALFGGRKV